MMEIVRRIIYTPPINFIIRNVLKPFRSILPERFKIPVSGQISVDTGVGGSIILATNQTSCLTQDVFWGGIRGYEYPSLRVFMELIKDMECFLDVGANLGYYSLIAARINPDLQVYAFEPMPGAYAFLEKNIALNGLTHNVHPVKLAVAERDGEVEFFVTRNPKALYLEHHLGGSSSTARAKDSYSETVRVKMGSLDDFVEREGITKVDIMKLDTEATEDKVLAGAEAIVSRDRPFIQCEVLPKRIDRELDSFFRDHQYAAFLPEEGGLRRIDSVVGHAETKDYFFVPESRLSVVQHMMIETPQTGPVESKP